VWRGQSWLTRLPPGNDVENDSDIPAAPAKIVEKTSTHTAKRNTDGAAPSKAPATSGARRGGAVSGNEAGTPAPAFPS